MIALEVRTCEQTARSEMLYDFLEIFSRERFDISKARIPKNPNPEMLPDLFIAFPMSLGKVVNLARRVLASKQQVVLTHVDNFDRAFPVQEQPMEDEPYGIWLPNFDSTDPLFRVAECPPNHRGINLKEIILYDLLNLLETGKPLPLTGCSVCESPTSQKGVAPTFYSYHDGIGIGERKPRETYRNMRFWKVGF